MFKAMMNPGNGVGLGTEWGIEGVMGGWAVLAGSPLPLPCFRSLFSILDHKQAFALFLLLPKKGCRNQSRQGPSLFCFCTPPPTPGMPAQPGKERGLQEILTEFPINPFLGTLETSPSKIGIPHTHWLLCPRLHTPLPPDAQPCWESSKMPIKMTRRQKC